MKITLYRKTPLHGLTKKIISSVVQLVLNTFNIRTDEVIVHFVNTQEICSLHQIYFNDPSPTDCISFPIDSPYESHQSYAVLGEIFICTEVADDVAKKRNCSTKDEILLYLIHGLLHLLGYDDLSIKDRKEMRQLESNLLKKVANEPFFAPRKKAKNSGK